MWNADYLYTNTIIYSITDIPAITRHHTSIWHGFVLFSIMCAFMFPRATFALHRYHMCLRRRICMCDIADCTYVPCAVCVLRYCHRWQVEVDGCWRKSKFKGECESGWVFIGIWCHVMWYAVCDIRVSVWLLNILSSSIPGCRLQYNILVSRIQKKK